MNEPRPLSIIILTLLSLLIAMFVWALINGTGTNDLDARALDYVSWLELAHTLLISGLFALPIALVVSFIFRRIWDLAMWSFFRIGSLIVLVYVIYQLTTYLVMPPYGAQGYFYSVLSDALREEELLSQLSPTNCNVVASRSDSVDLPYVRVFECSVETPCNNKLSYRFVQDALPDGGLHQFEEPILVRIARACPTLISDERKRDELIDIIAKDSKE